MDNPPKSTMDALGTKPIGPAAGEEVVAGIVARVSGSVVDMILEAIDLLAPLAVCGKAAMFGGAGAQQDDKGEHEDMQRAMMTRKMRRDQFVQEGERPLWQNLSMIGALGWLVVVPIVLPSSPDTNRP